MNAASAQKCSFRCSCLVVLYLRLQLRPTVVLMHDSQDSAELLCDACFQRDLQAANLNVLGAGSSSEDFNSLREGWDEMGFNALFQDIEALHWQPEAPQAIATQGIRV